MRSMGEIGYEDRATLTHTYRNQLYSTDESPYLGLDNLTHPYLPWVTYRNWSKFWNQV